MRWLLKDTVPQLAILMVALYVPIFCYAWFTPSVGIITGSQPVEGYEGDVVGYNELTEAQQQQFDAALVDGRHRVVQTDGASAVFVWEIAKDGVVYTTKLDGYPAVPAWGEIIAFLFPPIGVFGLYCIRNGWPTTNLAVN